MSVEFDGMAFLERLGRGALAEKMGIEFKELTASRGVATMPVLGNTQPMNLVHGGAYVVLAESLASTCAGVHARGERDVVGIEVSASHTGSAREGIVTGVCTAIHLGRTLTVHQIDITDDEGKLCSTVRITNFIKQAR